MLLFRAWQSILSWPIDEDRVPEFFADLLQQWGRERLVPVCGPPTKAEAESATMQWKRTGALPEWRKYSPAADATIEANVVAHPQVFCFSLCLSPRLSLCDVSDQCCGSGEAWKWQGNCTASSEASTSALPCT